MLTCQNHQIPKWKTEKNCAKKWIKQNHVSVLLNIHVQALKSEQKSRRKIQKNSNWKKHAQKWHSKQINRDPEARLRLKSPKRAKWAQNWTQNFLICNEMTKIDIKNTCELILKCTQNWKIWNEIPFWLDLRWRFLRIRYTSELACWD